MAGCEATLAYLTLVHHIRNRADNAGRAGAEHLLHSALLQGCRQVPHGEVPLRHLEFTLFANKKKRERERD